MMIKNGLKTGSQEAGIKVKSTTKHRWYLYDTPSTAAIPDLSSNLKKLPTSKYIYNKTIIIADESEVHAKNTVICTDDGCFSWKMF